MIIQEFDLIIKHMQIRKESNSNTNTLSRPPCMHLSLMNNSINSNEKNKNILITCLSSCEIVQCGFCISCQVQSQGISCQVETWDTYERANTECSSSHKTRTSVRIQNTALSHETHTSVRMQNTALSHETCPSVRMQNAALSHETRTSVRMHVQACECSSYGHETRTSMWMQNATLYLV